MKHKYKSIGSYGLSELLEKSMSICVDTEYNLLNTYCMLILKTVNHVYKIETYLLPLKADNCEVLMKYICENTGIYAKKVMNMTVTEQGIITVTGLSGNNFTFYIPAYTNKANEMYSHTHSASIYYTELDSNSDLDTLSKSLDNYLMQLYEKELKQREIDKFRLIETHKRNKLIQQLKDNMLIINNSVNADSIEECAAYIKLDDTSKEYAKIYVKNNQLIIDKEVLPVNVSSFGLKKILGLLCEKYIYNCELILSIYCTKHRLEDRELLYNIIYSIQNNSNKILLYRDSLILSDSNSIKLENLYKLITNTLDSELLYINNISIAGMSDRHIDVWLDISHQFGNREQIFNKIMHDKKQIYSEVAKYIRENVKSDNVAPLNFYKVGSMRFTPTNTLIIHLVLKVNSLDTTIDTLDSLNYKLRK